MRFTKRRKFRWGVMGCGLIAPVFIEAAAKTENQETAAVASKSIDRAQRLQQRFDIGLAFGSYEEMLKEAPIDGVYIATENTAHFENTLLALKYNKHVLCEKTCFINTEQLDQVQKIARRKKLLFMEAMWSRFLPAVVKLGRVLHEGKIGKVKYSHVSFCADLAGRMTSSPRMASLALGGGVLFDLGVYAVTFLDIAFSAKEVKTVKSSVIKFPREGTDAFASALLDYSSGFGEMRLSFHHAEENKQIIVGEKGSIEVFDIPHPERFEITYRSGDKEIHTAAHSRFLHEIVSFVKTVEQNKSENRIMSFAVSRRVLSVLEQIRKEHGIFYFSEKGQ